MPVAPSPVNPLPIYWTFFGHSYYQGAFGTHNPQGRADSIMRNLFGISQVQFTANHAVIGSRCTFSGNSSGGWTRVIQNVLGNTFNPAAPDIAQQGAFFLGWGINDVGNGGNTTQCNTAYTHALRTCISRCRCSRTFNPSQTTGIGAFTYGTGFSQVSFAWELSAGDSYATATVTTGATISWTIPADYAGGTITFMFLSNPGVLGASWTWGGTAGVTGTISTSNILPAAMAAGRVPVCRRITNLTSANAGQTITLTVSAIDAGGSADFGGAWIESPWPPPVLVANTARLPAAGYSSNYSKTFTSSLTGTAVASTPGTITLASGTTAGLSTAGSVTCPSAGGTVTISYTGGPGTTLNTLTGCTASGGSGNYTSNTLTWAGPTDADVAAFNTALVSLLGEFDGMVQKVDLDTAIGKNAAVLGSDGLHPNELGGARIADAFYAASRLLSTNSAFGEASQMNVPNQSQVPLIMPRVSGHWYTTPALGGTAGTAYTAVAGDLFAIPFTCTRQGEVWFQWSLETLAGSAAATVTFAVLDDRGGSGLPKYLYANPCSGPITLATGAAVFNSATSPGNGYLNLAPDPGLYWLTLFINTAGTGVTFRTMKGPSLLMPMLPSGGGGSTYCGVKATGQSGIPTSWPFPSDSGLMNPVDNCPMIGIEIF